MPEADAPGRHADPLGDLLHVEPDQVVGDRESPHLLADALGGAAAEGFLALEGMRLDLVEAELELPALVVQLDDLGGGLQRWIEQRGQQGLGAESAALVADGADLERLGQLRMGPTRLAREGHLDELVVGAQPSQRAPLEVRLGAGQPVALAARRWSKA